jgi:hypothetical protein
MAVEDYMTLQDFAKDRKMSKTRHCVQMLVKYTNDSSVYEDRANVENLIDKLMDKQIIKVEKGTLVWETVEE